MTDRLTRQHAAARLSAAGAALGVAAGITQTTAGSPIPAWTGNKASPVSLGLLSLAALVAHRRSKEMRSWRTPAALRPPSAC